MINCKIYTAVLITSLILTSCTKVINLKLGNNSGQLVIEGNITNLPETQYILLSKNVPFTNSNTYPPVSNAIVSVTDDQGNSYPFTEGLAGVYAANNFYGLSGHTYTINVLSEGVNYKATSVMPKAVPLDSLTSKENSFNSSDNRREITVNFQDPAGISNQYLFRSYVNNVQVKTFFAIDDEFTDGRYVKLDLIQSDIDIFPNDTVRVEMQCIDKPIYTYWFTLMQQSAQGPGGGVTPSNPPTNITPVSFGYFSAHTDQSITIVVK